ncbi:MAG: hypothetical protein AAF667_01525 [Pseudomonadota bacterium]
MWQGSPGQEVPMPLSQFVKGAERVAELCDLLEVLADDLPRKAPPVWREAVRLSSTIIPDHIDNIAHVLLPLLARRTRGETFCDTVLRRLQTEYQDCQSQLPELTDLLGNGLSEQMPGLAPEALGFALRGHFEMIRRQIDWERDVLLPLARRCLIAADFNVIAQAQAFAAKHAGTDFILSGDRRWGHA